MKIFDAVRVVAPSRNKFDLTHERKLSLNMGKLYPIFVEDVMPGDKFQCQSNVLLRFQALLAPIMHQVDVFVHYFFVPHRLVWTEWEDFITGGRDGTAAPVMPNMNVQLMHNAGWLADKTLTDHLGIPTQPQGDVLDPVYNAYGITALPYRAYTLICDTYYRDQNLEPSYLQPGFKASGAIPFGAEMDSICQIRTRAWEKDYFTSALPWAQRGAPVNVPITQNLANPPGNISVGQQVGGAAPAPGNVQFVAGDTLRDAAGNPILLYDDASQFTIASLRLANSLQRWLEKKAVGGARYKEQIKALFNVTSSDARLQRAEYLGGGKQPVVISEVLQQAPATTESPTPLATMSGHGISTGSTNKFHRFFEEHGTVMGILSVRPRTSYKDCMPRWAMRTSALDFPFPDFAHIGEQAIFANEVRTKWSSNSDPFPVTFGYTPRYSEFKYRYSTAHGDMKRSLAFWDLTREYNGNLVVPLDGTFIQCNPRLDIFAVTDPNEDHLIAHVLNQCYAIRPLPYFGTPAL